MAALGSKGLHITPHQHSYALTNNNIHIMKPNLFIMNGCWMKLICDERDEGEH